MRPWLKAGIGCSGWRKKEASLKPLRTFWKRGVKAACYTTTGMHGMESSTAGCVKNSGGPLAFMRVNNVLLCLMSCSACAGFRATSLVQNGELLHDKDSSSAETRVEYSNLNLLWTISDDPGS